MPGNKETPTTPPTARSVGWRKFLFTEEGVVTMLAIASALFTYFSHDPGDSEQGYVSRRLLWLEPFLGEYYLSVIMAILAAIMAAVTWIKHRR